MIEYSTTKNLLKNVVPISRFNKGEAGKIIEEVKTEGMKIIIKNNIPECVLISSQDWDSLMLDFERLINPVQSEEQEKRRKEFLSKIRKKIIPPVPAEQNRKEIMDKIGSIQIDKNAVNELRRVSTLWF